MISAQVPFILGDTFELVGALMIAYAAMRVNFRFRHEHKVDERVFAEMTREHRVALLGIALLVLGYCLHLLGNFQVQG
jgi:hypothetical protein